MTGADEIERKIREAAQSLVTPSTLSIVVVVDAKSDPEGRSHAFVVVPSDGEPIVVLQRQYSALERAISTLQGQSHLLFVQVAALASASPTDPAPPPAEVN